MSLFKKNDVMKTRSIFFKFSLLIVLAALVIAIVTHAALMYNFRRIRNSPEFYRSFQFAVELVVDRIDVADTAATRLFLSGRGINVRIVSENGEWTSSEDVPDLSTVRKIGSLNAPFWYQKRLVMVVANSRATFIVLGINPAEHYSFPWDIFIIWLCLLVAVFSITHHKIRGWLKPVRSMQVGVAKISEGDFSISLPETTSDELGQLVKSFNGMAQQIRNDIKSRDQLLRDISHELRSPLSRMLLALEFVPEGSARQTLKNNITVLDKMTGVILEEERLDSPFGKINCEQFDVCTLIKEIVDDKKTGGNCIRFSTETSLELNADKERIRIALANVIDNAVKYSSPRETPVEVKVGNEANEAVVTVIDSGSGIPDEDLPFIFEPFYRVDKARRHNVKGYGLGMSLTKKIIEAHHGTIAIESIVNKGTTVKIRLPR